MRSRWRTTLCAGAAIVAVAMTACGGDDEPAANTATPVPVESTSLPQIVSTPAPPEVRVADIGGRRILTDAGGFTLYIFNEDNAGDGTSACNGACAQAWPPFVIAGTVVTGPPDVTGQLSTITRVDTNTQVTYNGKPLYRFQADEAPGDMKGDNFGETWFAAQP